MDRNEARQKIASLVSNILSIAAKLPPSELAALAASSAPAKTPKAETAAEGKSAKSAKGKTASKPVAKGKTASKKAKGREYNRRDPKEIAAIHKGVLSALQGAEDYLKSSEIAKTVSAALGKTVSTEDIAFSLGMLRTKGLAAKKGDKVNAKYGATKEGRAHDGNFEKPAAKPAEATAN